MHACSPLMHGAHNTPRYLHQTKRLGWISSFFQSQEPRRTHPLLVWCASRGQLSRSAAQHTIKTPINCKDNYRGIWRKILSPTLRMRFVMLNFIFLCHMFPCYMQRSTWLAPSDLYPVFVVSLDWFAKQAQYTAHRDRLSSCHVRHCSCETRNAAVVIDDSTLRYLYPDLFFFSLRKYSFSLKFLEQYVTLTSAIFEFHPPCWSWRRRSSATDPTEITTISPGLNAPAVAAEGRYPEKVVVEEIVANA